MLVLRSRFECYIWVMPIYTKKGDKGRTKTFYGEMSKSDELAEVLGTIDELNSWIGFCRSKLRIENGELRVIEKELIKMQTNLLTIGTMLAGGKKRLGNGEIKRLERLIDKLTKELPPLKNFIYPVGEVQVARAVCRRAERSVVEFLNNTPSNPPLNLRGGRGRLIIKYLNRLSDALFTIARWVNNKQEVSEEVWK